MLLSSSLFAQCKLTLMLDLQLLNITAGRQKLKAKINLNPTYKQNKEKRVASLIDNQPGWCDAYYLKEHKILRDAIQALTRNCQPTFIMFFWIKRVI